VPGPSARLVFRPGEDEEFLTVFRRVAVGSLDVATRRDLAAMGADSQARDDLAFYRSCPGKRSWRRLTETADGADRITATTDVSNIPMAAAFDRANYQVTDVRLVFQR